VQKARLTLWACEGKLNALQVQFVSLDEDVTYEYVFTHGRMLILFMFYSSQRVQNARFAL